MTSTRRTKSSSPRASSSPKSRQSASTAPTAGCATRSATRSGSERRRRARSMYPTRPSSRLRTGPDLSVAGSGLDLAPAARPVVGDDLPEHRQKRRLVDRFALAKGNGSRGLVVVSGGDDAFGVGNDSTVVDEDVHVILGREQSADVPVEHEVGLHGALDRLL